MPVFDNFKNFMRHGKANREAHDGTSVSRHARAPCANRTDTLCTQSDPGPSARSTDKTANVSNIHAQPQAGFSPHDKSTAAPATTSQAQAQAAASHSRNAQPSATQSKSGMANEQYQKEAERIVAEERQASDKMPYHEGLSERFQLVKKMGE